MVVIDRQDYNTKAQGLLDDKDIYRPIPKDPTAKLKSQLINILKNCKTQGQINQDPYKRLYPICAIPSNSMTYPKSISQAPPKVHSIQQGFNHVWSS